MSAQSRCQSGPGQDGHGPEGSRLGGGAIATDETERNRRGQAAHTSTGLEFRSDEDKRRRQHLTSIRAETDTNPTFSPGLQVEDPELARRGGLRASSLIPPYTLIHVRLRRDQPSLQDRGAVLSLRR